MGHSEIINKYVKIVTEDENFSKFEIEIPGQTGKGDGYLSNVIFVTVTGILQNGTKKVLNYVVKVPSHYQPLREILPTTELFETEIHIYKNILPAFKNLQKKMTTESDLLDLLPVCHLSNAVQGQEIIILENVKSKGFDVWDRHQPLPYEHVKLILENYGKWHAFSFSLKDKEPETFKKLTDEMKFLGWRDHLIKAKMLDHAYTLFDEARSFWKNEKEISSCLKFTKDNVKYICNDLFFEDPEDWVIIHGDGWTNNFMFSKESLKSLKAYLIDWQLASRTSPVYDLSYFIYNCVDTGKNQHIDELLKIYYQSLSESLRQLSCDPSKLFTYDRLLYHWKKYSCFGVIMAAFIMKFGLSEGDETPDFVEIIQAGRDFADAFHFDIANSELYHKRQKDNFLHYIRNSK